MPEINAQVTTFCAHPSSRARPAERTIEKKERCGRDLLRRAASLWHEAVQRRSSTGESPPHHELTTMSERISS